MEPAKHRILAVASRDINRLTSLFAAGSLNWTCFFGISVAMYFLLAFGSSELVPKAVVLLFICLLIGRHLMGRPFWFLAVSCLGASTCFGVVFLPKLISRIHVLDRFWPKYMYIMLRAMGLPTRIHGSQISIMFGRDWSSFLVTPEWLGFWAFVILLTIWLPVAYASKRSALWCLSRLAICVMLIVPGFAILKALLISDAMFPYAIADPGWNVILLGICSPVLFTDIRAPERNYFAQLGPAVVGMAVVGLTTVLLSVQTVYLGARIIPEILIDDSHGEWEPTQAIMDEKNFGKSATYTYSNLTQLLSYYGAVSVNSSTITAQCLESYDILILKTPTTPYLQSELAAIWDFVASGGGLLVLGDHTNLMGMSAYLNEVLEPYRISFNYDSVFDLKTGGFNTWGKTPMIANPVNHTMPSHMRFETGSSLQAPLHAVDLLTLYGAGSDSLDWSNPGFFGDITYSTDERCGAFLSAVMLNASAGRVIVFSDSTVFSNFSLFLPGRQEFLLTCIDLLARSRSWGLSINVGIIAFGCFLVFHSVRQDKRLLSALFVIIGASTVCAWGACHFYYSLALGNFEPQMRVPRLVFYGRQGEFGSNWGTALLDRIPDDNDDFSTFYVASQRLGFFPYWLDEDLSLATDADALVVLDWQLLSEHRFLRHLRTQATQGKDILLLKPQAGPEGSVREIICSILGDKAKIAQGQLEHLTVATGDAGEHIYVYENMEVLSRAGLGKVDSLPDEEQLKNYGVAFELLRQLGADQIPKVRR